MALLEFQNIRLPLETRWQGASCSGPQTCCTGIHVTQQLDPPPGLDLQPVPPQVPQLAAQHESPFCTPPYVAHHGSEYI